MMGSSYDKYVDELLEKLKDMHPGDSIVLSTEISQAIDRASHRAISQLRAFLLDKGINATIDGDGRWVLIRFSEIFHPQVKLIGDDGVIRHFYSTKELT
jgi:hypothetical protein